MLGTKKTIVPSVGRFRWVVLVVIFLAYMVGFGNRINIGILLPMLKGEFSISNMEAGALASFFFLGYAVSQIPAGFWIRRFGVRTLVAVAIAASSAFAYFIGHTYSTIAIKWCRFGLGCAQGPVSVGSVSAINNWFPTSEKGIAVGFYIAAYMTATILTPPLCAWIASEEGWRAVFFWFAVPGFGMSIVWYLIVRNRPEQSRFCSKNESDYIHSINQEKKANKNIQPVALRWLDILIRARKLAPLTTPLHVFTSWNVWGVTVAYFCMMSVLYGLLTWIPSYLLVAKQYSFLKMGFVAAAPWVGGLIGSIFGGWFSDHILAARRKPMMLLGTLLTGIMMVCLIYVPENVTLVVLTLFFTGFALNLAIPLFTAYPMGLANEKTYPVTIAFINSAGNLGGFFSPMIAGALLDAFQQYLIVFSYFGLCMLISFAVVLMIEEPI